MKRDVAKGYLLTADTVEVVRSTPLYELRKRQDAWLGIPSAWDASLREVS